MAGLKSITPLDGSTVGSVPIKIPRAVERARAAQGAWRALGPEGRTDLLGKEAVRFKKEANALARLMTQEMGKPFR